MEHLRWHSRPGPAVLGSTHTVMVAAFSGWNDAADAASGAIDHLWNSWRAQRFATLEPDEYVDFTVSRPRVTVEQGVPGDLDWPTTELGWCTPTRSLSVVLVRGPEPQFRWPAFCRELVDAADELGCSTLIVLGAMLSEVPHTRDVPVFSAAHEPHILDTLDLPRSDYDGPTGIPSVLQQIAHRRGLETVGLWAALPGYAAGVPSPKGVAALCSVVAAITDAPLEDDDLESETREYAEHLDALVSEDEDTAEYVARLEEAYDAHEPAATVEELVAEVEDFLRDQG